MRKKTRLIGLMMGLLTMPAIAQDAVTIADARCVVAGMRIAASPASSQQSRGVLVTLYYLGKLDGRGEKRNVNSQIAAEASKMTEADYASETKRCEAGLTEKGLQLTQIGKDLIELEKATQDRAADKDH